MASPMLFKDVEIIQTKGTKAMIAPNISIRYTMELTNRDLVKFIKLKLTFTYKRPWNPGNGY